MPKKSDVSSSKMDVGVLRLDFPNSLTKTMFGQNKELR